MSDMPWDDFPDLDEPGCDYVQPADRSAEWASMAAEFARQGLTRSEIAYALCVDEPTAARLLELAGTGS